MRRTVLFAGGPLHGQVRTIDAARLVALERPDISSGRPDVYTEPRQVTYATSRFALCGRVIWIGHLGARPDEDLVFEVLTSDDAKLASEPRPIPSGQVAELEVPVERRRS